MRLSGWILAGAALAAVAIVGVVIGLGVLHLVAQVIANGAG